MYIDIPRRTGLLGTLHHGDVENFLWCERKRQVGVLLEPSLEQRGPYFDQVQIWRVRRQEEQHCSHRMNSTFQLLVHMNLGVVQDHDKAG